MNDCRHETSAVAYGPGDAVVRICTQCQMVLNTGKRLRTVIAVADASGVLRDLQAELGIDWDPPGPPPNPLTVRVESLERELAKLKRKVEILDLRQQADNPLGLLS
jgi:hypothetical protein